MVPRVFRAPSGAGLRRGRRSARVMVLLVAPLVFRAPEGPAAREARRPHFVRRRASKPARALRSLRRPPHQWGRAALCARGRRPAREPSVLRAFGSARRLEARPGPATAHGHRSLARCFLGASRGSRVLSFWGAWVRVVTNVVNPRAFELKMVVFGLRLTTFVTGVLAR